MENRNNSYNSLLLGHNSKKEIRSSTSYREAKRKIDNESNEKVKKNELNLSKKNYLEHNNSQIQITRLNIDKNFSNIQDSSTKEEDTSSTTISKFHRIHKHLNATNINELNDPNNHINNNLSHSNIFNKKDFLGINNNSNNDSIVNNKTNYNKQSNNNNYNRVNISKVEHGYYSCYNSSYKNYNSIIPPADPLLKRTIVPKVNPRFGKMKAHIALPEFKGEEPITKFEYKPILKEMLTSPAIEKQYEVSLYLNSSKMLNNLIYLKTQLSKEGLISLDNLVNVKKLNKKTK